MMLQLPKFLEISIIPVVLFYFCDIFAKVTDILILKNLIDSREKLFLACTLVDLSDSQLDCILSLIEKLFFIIELIPN